jgi:hypothetical protein
MTRSTELVSLTVAAVALGQNEAHVRRLCALDHLAWWRATDAIEGRHEILVTVASLDRWVRGRRKGRLVYRSARKPRGESPGRVIEIGIRPLVCEGGR